MNSSRTLRAAKRAFTSPQAIGRFTRERICSSRVVHLRALDEFLGEGLLGLLMQPQPMAWANEENRYKILIDAVTDYAIYMLDRNGIVSSWNAGAQRFKRYAASEIIGQHFSVFYPAEDRQSGAPAKALATAAREGHFESEGWRIRKDGTRFWAHVVIDPIRAPSGETGRFCQDHARPDRTQSALRKRCAKARSSSGCWSRRDRLRHLHA